MAPCCPSANSDVQFQRQAQDEAISEAQELFSLWPQARLRHAPELTVVSKLVPGPAAGPHQFDWDAADAAVTATVQEVVRTVVSCGAVVSGTPWRALAAETPEQKRRILTGEGSCWLVKVPFTADEKAVAALPGDVEVQIFEAREELSIFIPGKSSMAKYATALSRLAMHPLEAAYVDICRMRHLLHDEGVETAAAICTLDGANADG